MDKLALVNPISKEMRYFMTCAEEGSLLQASEKLSIQQAGLSKLIQKLEREIGKDLFFREPRGVRLTSYGQTLYETLLKTHQFWNQYYGNKLGTDFGLAGTFKIGCHSSVAANVFPLFFKTAVEAFPNLKIETEFMRSLEATRGVSENRLDLAIVINPVKNKELSVIKIKKEFVSLWRSKGDNQSALAINPEMFRYANVLKKYQSRRALPIADYETIGSLIRSTDIQGVLPSSIAERYYLEAVGQPLFAVDLAAVLNRKRMINDGKIQVANLIVRLLKKDPTMLDSKEAVSKL